MILLTVGTQLPFDRFVRIVDEAAPTIATPIFAQIGRYGHYTPKNMESTPLLKPTDFEALLEKVTLIVSHAGIGTVVMAQKRRLPIILFPRSAALREHRNDHQFATVSVLEGRPGIYVARTAEELVALLHRPLEAPSGDVVLPERARLIASLADFIKAG